MWLFPQPVPPASVLITRYLSPAPLHILCSIYIVSRHTECLQQCFSIIIASCIEKMYFLTSRCYITNEYNTLYYIANIGYLAVVFAFNTFMLGVTVVKLMSIRSTSSPIEKRRAWKDICTILGLSSLLGTTWGLAFFTFGPLSLPGLYFFCVLNSLQGDY